MKNHRDFEAFKLFDPNRKRARIVCSWRVPTKNAGANETSSLILERYSDPRFSCTIDSHFLCSSSFCAPLMRAHEVCKGINFCPTQGDRRCTFNAAFCAARTRASSCTLAPFFSFYDRSLGLTRCSHTTQFGTEWCFPRGTTWCVHTPPHVL